MRDDEISQNVARSASKVNGLYNVGQPYEIRQIPEGIAGNWFDGNVESYLTSVWVYGALCEGDMATAKDWTDAFYKTFYRIDDSSSYLEGFDSVRVAACPTG